MQSKIKFKIDKLRGVEFVHSFTYESPIDMDTLVHCHSFHFSNKEKMLYLTERYPLLYKLEISNEFESIDLYINPHWNPEELDLSTIRFYKDYLKEVLKIYTLTHQLPEGFSSRSHLLNCDLYYRNSALVRLDSRKY